MKWWKIYIGVWRFISSLVFKLSLEIVIIFVVICIELEWLIGFCVFVEGIFYCVLLEKDVRVVGIIVVKVDVVEIIIVLKIFVLWRELVWGFFIFMVVKGLVFLSKRVVIILGRRVRVFGGIEVIRIYK